VPQRPAMTDPGELLLFLTEPQQLDAVYEYGTETLSPNSIDLGDDEHAPDCDCPDCDGQRAADDDLDRWIDDTRGEW
jgi:hypothetical protein